MIIKPKEEKSEKFSIKENHNADAYAKFLPIISVDVDVLRVEEDVYTIWSGTTGCCEQSTVDSQANSAFVQWIQKKLYDYRHLNYKTYGHGGGTAHCTYYSNPWPDNSRHCRGSLTLKAYIEFYQRKLQ